MSYKLFSIKDGDIIINKVEILTIPIFTKILRRDKGSDGDHDGRKKRQAFREFAYIYHMADIKALPNRNGYGRKEANEYSKEAAGLDDKWIADVDIKQAIKAYEKEQESLPRNTILELIKTYRLIPKITGKLRNAIEVLIDTDDALSAEQADSAYGMISSLISQGDDVPKLTAKLVSAISQLEQLEEKDNREVMRGPDGELVPDSANPDTQL